MRLLVMFVEVRDPEVGPFDEYAAEHALRSAGFAFITAEVACPATLEELECAFTRSSSGESANIIRILYGKVRLRT